MVLNLRLLHVRLLRIVALYGVTLFLVHLEDNSSLKWQWATMWLR